MARTSPERALAVETRCLMRLLRLYVQVFTSKGFDIGLWHVDEAGGLAPRLICRDEGFADFVLRLPIRAEGDDAGFFADRGELTRHLDKIRSFIAEPEWRRLELATHRFSQVQRLRMSLEVEQVVRSC